MSHSATSGRAAAALLLALVAIQAPCSAGDTPASSISDERLEASYNAASNFIRYPALDRYMAQVLKRLQDATPELSSRSLRIHALDTSLPYSFVLDNGAIYVSSGLLARLDGEGQLAALIVLPLAAVVRQDQKTVNANSRRRNLRNYLPNLLLLTATAGLGAPLVAKSEAKARAEEVAHARAASDGAALQWLAAAGYDPGATIGGLRHLSDRLALEELSGQGEFNDPAQLAARGESLERVLKEAPAPAAAGPAIDPSGFFPKLSAYYGLRLAATELDDHAASVVPLLESAEAIQGETGVSSFIRAELLRRNASELPSVAPAIDAYRRCIAHADAPVAAFRELAFLYRRSGDADRARENFTAYLSHAPNAPDAPIIRSYLENP